MQDFLKEKPKMSQQRMMACCKQMIFMTKGVGGYKIYLFDNVDFESQVFWILHSFQKFQLSTEPIIFVVYSTLLIFHFYVFSLNLLNTGVK